MAKAKPIPLSADVGPVAVETCGECRWWKRSGAVTDFGLCVRFPPTPLAGAGSAQPSVRHDRTCGEFKRLLEPASEITPSEATSGGGDPAAPGGVSAGA